MGAHKGKGSNPIRGVSRGLCDPRLNLEGRCAVTSGKRGKGICDLQLSEASLVREEAGSYLGQSRATSRGPISELSTNGVTAYPCLEGVKYNLPNEIGQLPQTQRPFRNLPLLSLMRVCFQAG